MSHKKISVKLRRIEKEINYKKSLELMDDEKKELRDKVKNSFHAFVNHFWEFSGAAEALTDSWHIKAVCDHLEAVYRGEIKRLIINVPPSTGKSLLSSVLFPAWVWCNRPTHRFITTSYGQELAVRDVRFCRYLVDCPAYRSLFPDVVLDTKQSIKLTTTAGGARYAAGLGGSITGFHAHIVIADDPNNVSNALIKSARDRVNENISTVLPSRFINKDTGALVLIQQRMHTEDATGNMLKKQIPGLVHLRLPMEFEEDNPCRTVKLLGSDTVWTDPRKNDGEILTPRFTKATLDGLKKEFASEYEWVGQYQQRPAPKTGGIIRTDWFQEWDEDEPPEDLDFIIQSWDTAFKTKPTSSYSACTTWGLFKDRHGVPQVILLNLYRDKLRYEELRHMAQRQAKCYYDTVLEQPLNAGGPSPDLILIEERASGHILLDDLRRAGVNVTGFNPKRKGAIDSSKEARAHMVSHIIEAGRVWLPYCYHPSKRPNYVDSFLDACELFPMSETQDIIDTMSMTLLYLIDRREITNPTDKEYIIESYNKIEKPYPTGI